MFGFNGIDVQYWMSTFKKAKAGRLKGRFSREINGVVKSEDCTISINMDSPGYTSATVKTASGETFTVSLYR